MAQNSGESWGLKKCVKQFGIRRSHLGDQEFSAINKWKHGLEKVVPFDMAILGIYVKFQDNSLLISDS